MPTYDYGCKACGHEFQREQRISEKPIKKCPECGKLQARRLISRTSFVLKGGGWYNDLYSSGKPESADTGSASSADSGESAASTDKPDTKPKSDAKKSKSETKTSKPKSGGGKEAA